MLGIYIYSKSH